MCLSGNNTVIQFAGGTEMKAKSKTGKPLRRDGEVFRKINAILRKVQDKEISDTHAIWSVFAIMDAGEKLEAGMRERQDAEMSEAVRLITERRNVA
jgi:hypothetical protein